MYMWGRAPAVASGPVCPHVRQGVTRGEKCSRFTCMPATHVEAPLHGPTKG
jgi:hypothetical protein